MKQPLLVASLFTAVLLPAQVLAQNPVEIQFQTDPLQVQTGTEIIFTVLTVSRVLSMTWKYQGVTLGLWTGGSPTVNPVPQFIGRVTIAGTQLRIGGAQLVDAGSYTVEVIPLAPTDLVPNSRTVQLSVFNAVAGVSLTAPSIATEGRNVSLSCTWTAGTEVTVQWGKNGAAVVADSRITISGGSLVINPSRRSDAGEYSCTASNPVSAQTATRTVTVYYGPDTPVLTKETPKECVGGGDLAAGQTVRLTCLSDSLPPALFSWQRDGQAVVASPPDSGVLTLQTFSTNDSGQITCTARNGITGATSTQRTVLAVVGTCLNGGEVAGIVIGCLLLIIIIVVLIWLIVFLLRRRREQELRKNNPNPRPPPADLQTNGAEDLGQGPPNPLRSTIPFNPPLYHSRARHGDHPSRSSSTRLGVDNPAFVHTDTRYLNGLPNVQQQQQQQQQNPNILIQAAPAHGRNQPASLQLSLNPLAPAAAQQSNNNNNGAMPTIHVNLNPYPANSLQSPQQDGGAANQAPSQNLMGPNGPVLAGHTHSNGGNTLQRNANTQTYQQEPDPRHPRPDRSSDGAAVNALFRRQMPWDRFRETPSYPRRTPPPAQRSSDTSDYESNSAPSEELGMARTLVSPRTQAVPYGGGEAPPRHDVTSLVRQIRSRTVERPAERPAERPVPRSRPVPSSHIQSTAQSDIRVSSDVHAVPRQEAASADGPQAILSASQPAFAMSPQRTVALQGADTRALADPNHLPQAHVAQQHRAAPIQEPARTQAVGHEARLPRQGGGGAGGGSGGMAPAQQSSAGAAAAPYNRGTLTQNALRVHTQRSQTFQSRRQQTQAALLHPGPQATRGPEPPTPPPAIPLAEFRAIPRKQHKSPSRGPQPPRPPANIPAAQRHQQARQQQDLHHHHHHHHHLHHRTMPAAAARHHSVNGHVHATTQRHAHARGHGHLAHFTHQQQQQAHRGRPR